jgi:hypothetical protein
LLTSTFFYGRSRLSAEKSYKSSQFPGQWGCCYPTNFPTI